MTENEKRLAITILESVPDPIKTLETAVRIHKYAGLLPLLAGLSDFLKTTADAKKPMTSGFRCDIGDRSIDFLHLWCSVGEGNPIQRIQEMREEIDRLKDQIAKQ